MISLENLSWSFEWDFYKLDVFTVAPLTLSTNKSTNVACEEQWFDQYWQSYYNLTSNFIFTTANLNIQKCKLEYRNRLQRIWITDAMACIKRNKFGRWFGQNQYNNVGWDTYCKLSVLDQREYAGQTERATELQSRIVYPDHSKV